MAEETIGHLQTYWSEEQYKSIKDIGEQNTNGVGIKFIGCAKQ